MRRKLLLSTVAVLLVVSIAIVGCAKPAPAPAPAPAPTPAPAPAPAPPAPAPEKYPSKPIRIIMPWGAGGGGDRMTRKMASMLEKELGVPFPVENLPGASGAVGTTRLIAQPADGYHIAFLSSTTVMAIYTGTLPTIRMFDDIVPVARLQFTPSFLFTYPGAPWETAEEFMEYAKEHEVRCAVSGIGDAEDFFVRSIAAESGLKTVSVAYGDPGKRYASVMGGHNHALFEQLGDVLGHVEAGMLVPLLAIAPERAGDLPDVQCMGEIGMKGLMIPKYRAFIAKTGTPEDIVKLLSDTMAKIDKTDEWRQFQKEMKVDVEGSFLGYKEFAEFIRGQAAEMEALKKYME